MKARLLPLCGLAIALLGACADLLGVETLSGTDAASAPDAGFDLPDGCSIDWVDAAAGVLPPGAIPNHPLDDSGLAIYVCRAPYEGEVVPGKLRPGYGCYFGDHDGGEVLATEYQALVPTGCTVVWKGAPAGYEPAGVLPCGQDSLGRPYYSCRVTTGTYVDELGHIGWGTNHLCVYSYAQVAYSTADFAVLTFP